MLAFLSLFINVYVTSQYNIQVPHLLPLQRELIFSGDEKGKEMEEIMSDIGPM
jgi:hypothetical protein